MFCLHSGTLLHLVWLLWLWLYLILVRFHIQKFKRWEDYNILLFIRIITGYYYKKQNGSIRHWPTATILFYLLQTSHTLLPGGRFYAIRWNIPLVKTVKDQMRKFWNWIKSGGSDNGGALFWCILKAMLLMGSWSECWLTKGGNGNNGKLRSYVNWEYRCSLSDWTTTGMSLQQFLLASSCFSIPHLPHSPSAAWYSEKLTNSPMQ